MNIEEIRTYCLEKTKVSEGMPFGDDTLVFKVCGKIFLLVNLEGPLHINIKGKPENVADRLDRYAEVKPGYHMNKMHWYMVDMEQVSDNSRIRTWIDESYNLIVAGLQKKMRDQLYQ